MSKIYISPPHLCGDEITMLRDAVESNWIAPLGPHVDAFEREFARRVGVGHGAALSSGTAALHLALLLLGVGEGDEVLAPTLTFVATPNAIRYVGAVPVFIDSDRETWNMDPNLLEAELRSSAARNALPKAVIVVDLYGQCAAYEAICSICERYQVPIIEDAAEALGATYQGRPAGSFGALSAFSFNGNKIITTSGGGMLVTDDESRAARARHLASQARDPVPHYSHSEVGFNYRLSNLLAAVGRAQLGVLEQRVAARRAINQRYRSGCADMQGVEFMPEAPECQSTFWLTALTIEAEAEGATPESVRQHLDCLGIESRQVWKPMHLQTIYSKCRFRGSGVADDLFRRGLCLPSGSNLSVEDQGRVIEGLRSALALGG